MIDNDYTDDDRYDWDRTDSRQYCEHGTFIGSSWGPDLMCGDCEMGYTVKQIERWEVLASRRKVTELRDRTVSYIIATAGMLDTFDDATRIQAGNMFRSINVILVRRTDAHRALVASTWHNRLARTKEHA